MNKPANQSDLPEISLEDRVRLSFERLGYPQLNAIKLTANGNVMLMTGKLNSFYLKQIAQTVAIKVPGISSVDNKIEVV